MASRTEAVRLSQRKAFDAAPAAPDSLLRLPAAGGGIPEGWFLGPKAENEEILLELLAQAVRKHSEFRRSFHPQDPERITGGGPTVAAISKDDRRPERLRLEAV